MVLDSLEYQPVICKSYKLVLVRSRSGLLMTQLLLAVLQCLFGDDMLFAYYWIETEELQQLLCVLC